MLTIAHRGASGYVLENTVAAFQHAIDMRCDMIEMDVRACATGEIVVFHDDTLERLVGRPEHIDALSLKELRQVRMQGHAIPTLEEALIAMDGKAQACIELKVQGHTEALADLLKYLWRKGVWTPKNLYVISFFHHELVLLRDRLGDVRIAPIMVGIPEDLAKFASDIDAYAMHPCIHFLDQPFVDDAHAKGLKVMVWTADNQEEIAKGWQLKVDGITSNYPDRIAQYKPLAL